MSDHTHDHDEPMNGGEHHDAMHPDDHGVEPTFDVTGAALGALAPDEEAAVLAAAANDPALAAELAGLRNVASELARLAPTHPINRGRSAGIRSRLLARAAASHAGRPVRTAAPEPERTPSRESTRPTPRVTRQPPSAAPAPTPQQPQVRTTGTHRTVPYEPSRWSEVHVGRWLAMAAGLLIVAGGVYAVSHMRITRDNTTAAAAQRDSVLSSEVAALRAEVERRDSVIGALTGMHTRVIDLVSNQSAEPMARMFWDQQTQQWTMYASHIKPPAPGKTYQLWLIARGRPQPISGGTFNPDQNGSAVMTARMALEPGALRRIAVTEEPDGGMPAPTGPIMFAGQ